MTLRLNRLRAAALAGTAFLAAAPIAHADPQNSDGKIDALQQQVQQLNAEIEELKQNRAAEAARKASEPEVRISFKRGRPTLTSSDGNFSLSLRTLVQFDTAYYAQGKSPAGIDFSSGSNFRRARFGASGMLFKDWSWEFIYDFGGSGVESSSISSAFIQYDALAPFHFRIGAYAPPAGFDDQTSASDLLFLERAQPADVARSIAAADGRDAATIFAYDENYFASVSYTGGVAGDSAVFDEQQALVGRLAYRFVKTPHANLALGGNATYVFNLADTVAGPGSPSSFRLRERPELNVDSNNFRLIGTGAIDADRVSEWGVEAAGNWRNLYAQSGYFGYAIGRRDSILSDPSFDGWYAQASWVLTGEAKPYKPEKAAYGLPSPHRPFSFEKGGIGAWELAARYSVLDLNDNAGFAGFPAPAGGARGGRQNIWTAGLNWYPNDAIRFLLDYQHTGVSRLNVAGTDIGASLEAIALRAQLSF